MDKKLFVYDLVLYLCLSFKEKVIYSLKYLGLLPFIILCIMQSFLSLMMLLTGIQPNLLKSWTELSETLESKINLAQPSLHS